MLPVVRNVANALKLTFDKEHPRQGRHSTSTNGTHVQNRRLSGNLQNFRMHSVAAKSSFNDEEEKENRVDVCLQFLEQTNADNNGN